MRDRARGVSVGTERQPVTPLSQIADTVPDAIEEDPSVVVKENAYALAVVHSSYCLSEDIAHFEHL